MGALMGGSVGLCIGFIFGSYAIFKGGAGPNGVIRSLGQYMLGSAATFGYVPQLQMTRSERTERLTRGNRFFMSIGTAIRTEGNGKSTVWETLMERERMRRRVAVVLEGRR